MTDQLDTIRASIDRRLAELAPYIDEHTRLTNARRILDQEPAKTAATPGRRRPGPRARRQDTRADQAVQIIASRPGITVGELADTLNTHSTYLYRVLPRLQGEGRIVKRGSKYYPSA